MQTERLVDLYTFQSTRQAELEKLEPEFFAAGFDEKSTKGLPWLLDKMGWSTLGPEPVISRSKALEELIEKEKTTGIMYYDPSYEELAREGDVEAMCRAGPLLRDGRSAYPGSDEDIRGIEWLQKAADEGDVLAQYLLDPKKTDASAMAALAWIGDIEALYDLGHMVEKGYGSPASPAAAFIIWNMAWNLMETAGSERIIMVWSGNTSWQEPREISGKRRLFSGAQEKGINLANGPLRKNTVRLAMSFSAVILQKEQRMDTIGWENRRDFIPATPRQNFCAIFRKKETHAGKAMWTVSIHMPTEIPRQKKTLHGQRSKKNFRWEILPFPCLAFRIWS